MDSLKFVNTITHTPTVPPTVPANISSPATGQPRTASQAGLSTNVQVATVPKRSWSRDMLLGDAGVAELTNYLIHSRSITDLLRKHKFFTDLNPEQYVSYFLIFAQFYFSVWVVRSSSSNNTPTVYFGAIYTVLCDLIFLVFAAKEAGKTLTDFL